MLPATAPLTSCVVRAEVAAAMRSPAARSDGGTMPVPGRAARRGATPFAVSVLDDESLERLRDAIWELTGLIRVYLRHAGETDEEPLALEPGATVGDVADAIHHELGASCAGGRVWGPSARFAGQQVGRAHVVRDGDVVEVLAR
jgi:ribosome-interacting GTPase 1